MLPTRSRPMSVSTFPNPEFRWWVPADGIRRDVISADIQLYLGGDALVRPGPNQTGQAGYWIAAHRGLSQSMVQDLKADSANFKRSGSREPYLDSQIHHSRQYWGPSASKTSQSTKSLYPPRVASESRRTAQSLTSYVDDSQQQQSPTHPLLDLKRQQIRLLRITSIQGQSGVSCHLTCHYLSDCPRYIALSYRWGPRDQSTTITLQGTSFRIGKNLADFLGTRKPCSTLYYWIDALCINQKNIHERNHQVNQMHQIYSQAHQVIVWLGDGEDGGCSALSWVAGTSSDSKPNEVELYEKLCALFNNPYWSRMWIIQEIMYAQKLAIRCGTVEVDWEDIQLFFNLFHKTLHPRNCTRKDSRQILDSKAGKILRLKTMYRDGEQRPGHQFTLLTLMRWTKPWSCTDRRDKVFALVALTSLSGRFQIDYGMSVDQLYEAVLKLYPGEDQFLTELLQLGDEGTMVKFCSVCASNVCKDDHFLDVDPRFVWCHKE
jgi:hypothetical protein